MFNFFKLCINESIKILKMRLTIVFGILIIIGMFLSGIYTNFTINQELYSDKGIEYYKNDNITKAMIEKCKEGIAAAGDNEKVINSYKAAAYYYQYAIDNNIHLYVTANGTITQEYWKMDMIQKLIKLKTSSYDLESSSLNVKKLEEVNKEIENLTKILQNDNYNKYIDLKLLEYEEEYKNHEISVYTRDLNIYMAELKRKYEMTRYNDSSNFWKYNSNSVILQTKSMLIRGENKLYAEEEKRFNDKINTEIYRLENNIAINNLGLTNYNDLYIEVSEKVLSSILALFIIITACLNMANEFSKRTIKQVLMSPNKRWKILLSKIVTLTVMLIIFSIILSLIIQLLGNIFFVQHTASHYVYIVNGQTNIINNVLYNVLRFLVVDIKIFIYMLFGLMLGTVIRSSAVATGISVFVYAGDTMFMELINTLITKEWIKFIPLNDFNLLDKIFPNASKYIASPMSSTNIIVNNITLNFSTGVILVCVFLLIISAFESFNKRELI